MAKFCGKCGSGLDAMTGLCPNCDIAIRKPVDPPKHIEKEPMPPLQPRAPLSKKEAKRKQKAAKRARADILWEGKTFGQKFKTILLTFLVWVLIFSVLAVFAVGLLVYHGILNIPFVEAIIDQIIVEEKAEDVDRDTPETDTTSFTFYQSSGKNLVQDSQTGFTYINNEILVTLTSDNNKHDLESYLDTIGGSIVGEIPELADYQILLDKEYTYEQLMQYVDTVKQFDWVISASVNYALRIDASYIPNDKKWKSVWGNVPDGINWGVEAIDAEGAWEYRQEMEKINIGVIDTMFDLNHEDLAFAETPLGTAEVSAQISNGIREWNDHGSHTAGTMAASFNNKTGISGISTGSNLYGVAIWGLESHQYSSLQAWKVSFYYLIAVNQCKAINVSMSHDQLTFEASRKEAVATAVLQTYADGLGRFLRSLIDLDYEFVICKSAGNQNEVGGSYKYFKKAPDDTNTPFEYYSYSDYLNYLNDKNGYAHLARYNHEEIAGRLESGNVDADFDFMGMITDPEVKDRIIMVGAIQSLGTHKEGGFLWFGQKTVHDGYAVAAFSQCGECVDILAPGVSIYSTIKNGYSEMHGTSMAAPHVTGVAALVFSINPDLDGARVKKIICDTATGQYGKDLCGLLNARNAVELARYSTDSGDVPPQIDQPIKTTSEERDIVLVLDVSSSMSGAPIEETKKASVNFIDTILDEDASIGIVTYANSAAMLSDFSVDETALMTAVTGIREGGGTNIEAGLAQARSMLSTSSAKKKIIVLMSDGEPNNGKAGDALIDYADELKDEGIMIYTLGFFESLGSYKYSAQVLMEAIASEGCHYEVASANDLVFFFEDMADQINGQKYIYIRIACPVDVTVTHNGQTLCSAEDALNVRTDFGTLSFENSESTTDEEDLVKVLRLKEGTDYHVQINGTGRGAMNYTIGFMDEDGEYSDLRRFRNIKITKRTVIDTVAEKSSATVLNIDEDGDGSYDLKYRATENGRGEVVDYTYIIYIVASAIVLLFVLILAIKIKKNHKQKK